ncbi:hypothetical protein COL154_005361 [Colletotrichum chrysophilum]|uniref:uncharacterized protein n=1 Tax=Colletotrichum chrysophilum TaxID=1836956 RepID=UPI002300ED9C|nr:uncharacterized protein COL26b_005284 [Colletotrichum chrysophilum]KAJ0363792.1 hypothetical protein COL154_005361 [Colletotrichum chrysophilum]KAJ0376470.1 hypothetical protein COL26b_005284 [Colletotrichum chrysophilum]
MRFSTLKFAIAALAICSNTVFGQTTPSQVVSNINMLTQKSEALQAPAESITIVNGPLIVAGQGPFPMQGMAAIPPGANSDAILEAFRGFVRVHQALLEILIGKAGLFSTVPFIGQPIAAALRQIEAIVDTLAFTLIDTLEGQASEIQSEADSLSATIGDAITSYQGVNLD